MPSGSDPTSGIPLRSDEHAPYQQSLRAVGRFLDEQRAYRLNLLELTDGLALRFQPGGPKQPLTSVTLTWQELFSLDGSQSRLRDSAKRRFWGSKPAPDSPSDGYENFLRSLGYELDATRAFNIGLDEMDDGMILTYVFLNPSESYLPHKRMVYLKPKDVTTILEDALSRRSQLQAAPRERGVTKLLR